MWNNLCSCGGRVLHYVFKLVIEPFVGLKNYDV